jgi:hypothetical protein
MDRAELLRIADAAGLEPADAAPLAGGQHGAWSVRTTAGDDLVVKVSVDAKPPWAAHGVAVTAALADRGLPVARFRRLGWFAGHHVSACALLPGTAPDVLRPAAWHAVLELQRAQTGLARTLGIGRPRSWREAIAGELAPEGPWRHQHAALRAQGEAGRRLVDAIQARAPGCDLSTAREGDVVHGDLHHGNLLVDAGGALTGVIDWDGWSPGDCRADLVTLLFSARIVTRDQALVEVLGPALRDVLAPDVLWSYAARDVVRVLGWFAWQRPAEGLEHWIAGCEALLREPV